MEAFDRGDALHMDIEATENGIEIDDSGSDIVDGLELYEQGTIPLYTGSKTSVVSTIIIIMNMCTVFHVGNKFIDELLHYLSEDLLPTGNKLPSIIIWHKKLFGSWV